MNPPTIAGMPVAVVRHPRARRVRLMIDPARRVLRLSVPPRASLQRAMAWAESQGAWVERELARLAPATRLVDGATIPFADTRLRIEHCPAMRRGCRRDGDRLQVGGPTDRVEAAVLRWLRREALVLLSAETAEFAERAGVSVARVAVGETRSRWGSCSAAGVIRYSWRLVLAPAFVRRSTVAHEVAHRLHMNHSPAFYAGLATIADGPADAALLRDWLRANGPALHGIGGSIASS